MRTKFVGLVVSLLLLNQLHLNAATQPLQPEIRKTFDSKDKKDSTKTVRLRADVSISRLKRPGTLTRERVSDLKSNHAPSFSKTFPSEVFSDFCAPVDNREVTKSTPKEEVPTAHILELNRLSGVFTGYLTQGSVRKRFPVTTTFAVDNGSVSGRYLVENSDVIEGEPTEYEGKLVLSRCNGETLSFEWQDRYGHGTLHVMFEPNRESFHGQWSSPFSPNSYQWTGNRKGN
ncbi:MAG: hypothetical protein K2W95_25775 [Candidatus Obscuribacterales bacterium]|nr:hypothetical protein [Candidatus Obscuribacterales bacterium]